MNIKLKSKNNFYYVESDDCYIFYYLFRYKIKDNKCYFRKSKLKRMLEYLDKIRVDYKLINSNNIYIYITMMIILN